MATLFADTDTQTQVVEAAIEALRRGLAGERMDAGDNRAIAEALLGESLAVGITETKAQLASLWHDQIGPITERQITNWAQTDGWPDTSNGWPLLAIAYHVGHLKTRGGRKSSEQKAALELRKLELEVENRARLNAEASGHSIPRAAVDRLYTATILEARTALARIPLASKTLEALSGQRLREELESITRDVMTTLSTGDEHAERAADLTDALYGLAEVARQHRDELPAALADALEALDAA